MPTQIADVGADALREAKSNLDSDYIPRDDEEFMNERQQEYFRGLLLAWKKSILTEAERRASETMFVCVSRSLSPRLVLDV